MRVSAMLIHLVVDYNTYLLLALPEHIHTICYIVVGNSTYSITARNEAHKGNSARQWSRTNRMVHT
jgi:hypothetical protein